MSTLEEIAQIEKRKHPSQLSLFIYKPLNGGYDLVIDVPHWRVPGKHFNALDALLDELVKIVKNHFEEVKT